MVAFKDAVAPLPARLVREHQVLHIAADLPTDDGAIESARREILKWAQKRSGGRLPNEAMAGRSSSCSRLGATVAPLKSI